LKTEKELNLLVDIAKLIRKYGPEPFESLAQSILSPQLSQDLSNILMQTSKVARAISEEKEKYKTKEESPILRSLLALKRKEPEKYRLLTNFHNGLVTKTLLPSLREIKEFASDCGLPEIRAESRQKAISPLVGSLAKLPYEQLAEKIKSIRKHGKEDRSLEGWTNIILDREGT